ncbi:MULTISPECIES: LysE family transporter [unclassified Acidovorax]|uniref:LysE family transporter n=1 Tax=unclassified Acidovorax TaxID=2684926 RepID=UPI0028832E48|nr:MULTISPECIES: LysE family transporter [unclassified Acidovorax]
MDLHTWIAFFAASCLIAVSPGSGAVLSMSHGLSYGVRKTSATIFGLQLGLLLILVVAGAGVGSLLIASEVAFSTVKVLGACYLIYLGFSQWRAGGAAPQDGAEAAPANAGPWQRRVLTGFLTNATNPKGIIFMVAVLPQFMTDARPLWTQLLVMAATTLSVDVVVMHGYAASASALRRLMRSPRAARNQNRVFGGLLMAVGAGLFFVKRGGQHA